jgi:hypothetical protein
VLRARPPSYRASGSSGSNLTIQHLADLIYQTAQLLLPVHRVGVDLLIQHRAPDDSVNVGRDHSSFRQKAGPVQKQNGLLARI